MREERNYDSFKMGNDTLCWACAKASCLGCRWIRSNIPIENWEAEPMKIKNNTKINGKPYPYYTPSYKVIKCPEYEYDGRTRPTHATRRKYPELFRKKGEERR